MSCYTAKPVQNNCDIPMELHAFFALPKVWYNSISVDVV